MNHASEFEVEYSAYIQFLKENPVTMKYALYLEEKYSQRKLGLLLLHEAWNEYQYAVTKHAQKN